MDTGANQSYKLVNINYSDPISNKLKYHGSTQPKDPKYKPSLLIIASQKAPPLAITTKQGSPLFVRTLQLKMKNY